MNEIDVVAFVIGAIAGGVIGKILYLTTFTSEHRRVRRNRTAAKIPDSRYVKTSHSTGKQEVEHLDGVDWVDADLPPRLHTCWAQTRAWMNYFTRVERCACGAIQIDRKGWAEKNQRRKDGGR